MHKLLEIMMRIKISTVEALPYTCLTSRRKHTAKVVQALKTVFT